LLDRPVGLRAATNPLPAEGGADPESADEARRNAPTKVKTFDRAVSLRDVEALATSSGEIAKASAALVWDGDVQAVHLTVAAAGGLVPGADVLARLTASLDARRDPNRAILVAPFAPIPIVIAATLRIAPTHVAPLVAARAREAMIAALAFEALSFGQSVTLSDVYAVLQDVTGVESVDVDVLQFKRHETMTTAQLAARGATTAPLQQRLRIFGARANRPPLRGASPAEQARLESPDTDLLLATSGGLTD
jgi:predicted phage baseplate assembly protein